MVNPAKTAERAAHEAEDGTAAESASEATLSAADLLAGSGGVHEIAIAPEVLRPGAPDSDEGPAGTVRLRPLTVGVLTMISRAARDDPGLVPLLMIKESLVEPKLGLDEIRRLHIGLVDFLVRRINTISGLGADGSSVEEAASSNLGRTHLLLARHFGWTPEQVSQLTPGQVAVYLAGIEMLLRFEEQRS